MKTIAYRDKASGQLRTFDRPDLKRHDRIRAGLDELQHMGNIVVYLQHGNRLKRIANKGY